MTVLWSRPSTKVPPASAPPRWPAWSPLRLRLHRSAPVAMSCATIRPSRLTYTVSSPNTPGVSLDRPTLLPVSRGEDGHDVAIARWLVPVDGDDVACEGVGEHHSVGVVAPVDVTGPSVDGHDLQHLLGRVLECVGDEDVVVARARSTTSRSARPPGVDAPSLVTVVDGERDEVAPFVSDAMTESRKPIIWRASKSCSHATEGVRGTASGSSKSGRSRAPWPRAGRRRSGCERSRP